MRVLAEIVNRLKEVFLYRDFLINLTIIELKLRYRQSILGFLWTILNPLFYLFILALVFSRIIRFNVPAYTTFLFSGLVSWLMLQQTIIIGTASIVNNQHLIRKVYVPKMAFPLSNVLARYVDHLALIVILIFYLILFQFSFSPAFAFLPVSILLHFLFSFGAVLLLSVVFIKVRDIQQIVAIIFQALFYASPVIYPAEALPEKIHFFLKLNPCYYFIQVFRYPIYSRAIPPLSDLAPACAISLITLAAGLWLFSCKEKEIVFYLS